MNKLLFSIALLICLSACGEKKVGQADPKLVKTSTVISEDGSSTPVYTGKVVSSLESTLSFRVSGKLDKLYVKEGQAVAAGQLLASLDPADYQTQLDATEAEYKQIKGEAERVMALYEEQAVTKSKYEKALYGLEQISAKLKNHRQQLSYTKLYAPVSGSISRKIAEEGEVVGAGRPVVVIVGNGKPEIEINVAAADHNRISSAHDFNATISAVGERSFPLRLLSVSPSANANQLFTVRLSFAGDSKGVTPGMVTTVRADMPSTGEGFMRIPNGSVFRKDGKTYVFACRNDKAVSVEVEVEELRPNGDFIVKSGGLNPGDEIISSGVHHVKPGEAVKRLSVNSGDLL